MCIVIAQGVCWDVINSHALQTVCQAQRWLSAGFVRCPKTTPRADQSSAQMLMQTLHPLEDLQVQSVAQLPFSRQVGDFTRPK